VNKPVIWSFSALNQFEQCPKQYWHLRVVKDVKEPPRGAQDEGIRGHKAFELRIKQATPLPAELAVHEPVIGKLAKPGAVVEQKLAINAKLEPVAFFADDVWGRAVADYVYIHGDTALLVDYKFGKRTEGNFQLRITAALLKCKYDQIGNFRLAYYWAKSRKFEVTSLPADNLVGTWGEIMGAVNMLERAFRHDEFPARRNGLCKAHCPVLSCVHNGRGQRGNEPS
jgi:hypothetical protein